MLDRASTIRATENNDDEEEDNNVSSEAVSDIMKQISRVERTFSQRISEVEKYGSKFVQIND